MAVPRSSATNARGGKNPPPAAPPSSSSASPSPRKRTKSPGVRVIGGRIYDSERGKTCHQCRQKTMDFAAPCRQIRRDKPCPIKFCHKCLLNRYGENAEEVAALEDWSCPKCRGVCNCSFCMKKKGHQPTGILIHAAKATGFSSVHELLDNNGSEVLNAASGLRSLSAGNSDACKKGSVVPKRSRGKEKFYDEQKDAELSIDVDYKKYESLARKEKKRRRKKLKCVSENGGGNVAELCGDKEKPKNCNVQAKDAKKGSARSSKTGIRPKPVPKNCSNGELGDLQHVPRPPKQSSDDMYNCINIDEAKVYNKGKSKSVQGKPPRKGHEFKKRVVKNSNGDVAKVLAHMQNKNVKSKPLLEEHKSRKCGAELLLEHGHAAAVIPQGTPLIEVGGVDWAAEDVGAALQFLEFCNAFSEVLDIKKGEPECILRELARGRVGRRGVYSSIVKFHVKLLSFVEKDMGDESISCSTNSGDQWLQSLVKCIIESECALMAPLDCLNKGPLAYDSLDTSNKLRLLNLLCDRTLGTEKLRGWIDEENNKYIERKKEAKETVIAAKKKGKDLKKKLKDDIARAILSLREGPALSVAEHENLVSQIKAETEKAQAEMLEIMEHLPKNSDKIRRDAVRTEPIILDGEGHVYWKLAGCFSNSKIIIQDIGSWHPEMLVDKWFAYDEEEEKSVDRHISSLRNRMRRIHGKFQKQTSEVGHDIGYPCNKSTPNCLAEGDGEIGGLETEQ